MILLAQYVLYIVSFCWYLATSGITIVLYRLTGCINYVNTELYKGYVFVLLACTVSTMSILYCLIGYVKVMLTWREYCNVCTSIIGYILELIA
jgi:hypothetical protein